MCTSNRWQTARWCDTASMVSSTPCVNSSPRWRTPWLAASRSWAGWISPRDDHDWARVHSLLHAALPGRR
jgi:hypothetical protein